MIIKTRSQLQLFGGWKSENAEVWALHLQEAIIPVANVDTWRGDLVLLPSCVFWKDMFASANVWSSNGVVRPSEIPGLCVLTFWTSIKIWCLWSCSCPEKPILKLSDEAWRNNFLCSSQTCSLLGIEKEVFWGAVRGSFFPLATTGWLTATGKKERCPKKEEWMKKFWIWSVLWREVIRHAGKEGMLFYLFIFFKPVLHRDKEISEKIRKRITEVEKQNSADWSMLSCKFIALLITMLALAKGFWRGC